MPLPPSPPYLSCLVAVAPCRAVSSSPSANPAVQGLVQEVLTELLGGAADIQAYTAAYAQRHSSSSSSLRQQAAGVEMAALLDPASKAAGIKQLLSAGPVAAAGSGAAQQQLADCIEVHRLLLAGPLADGAAAAEWKQRCASAFAHSSYFGGAAATPADKLKLNPAELKQALAA